jgi:hypothetical protein
VGNESVNPNQRAKRLQRLIVLAFFGEYRVFGVEHFELFLVSRVLNQREVLHLHLQHRGAEDDQSKRGAWVDKLQLEEGYIY